MTTCLRAEWLLPIDRPPIRDGWIQVEAGQIVRLGDGPPPAPANDLGRVVVLPGLVNAHTHVELSWMAGLVPPSPSMNAWIGTLMRVRRAGPAGGPGAAVDAARNAASAMVATGTVLVGDISNTLTTAPVFADAGLGGVLFHEVLGFNVLDPAGIVADAWARVARATAAAGAVDLRPSVVAHAPYSVSPALVREIARQHRAAPLSVHLGESAEEVEFLRTGGGPIRPVLESLGVWTDTWQTPGCDPVEYMHRLGYLRRGVLVAHGVHLTDDGLERLRLAGAVVVTCPRSNEWVGAGPPRLARFYASGVPVAVGTDSLASVSTLNLFDEIAEMRRIAPEVAAASLLESATRVGAQALGFGATHGTLAPGKRAALVSVNVPPGVSDVEEYLVGGVPKTSVRRLPY